MPDIDPPDLLRVERYLDAAPRTDATAMEVGPFTLFVGTGPWPYYARPRIGSSSPITAADVDLLRAHCAAIAQPLSIEWVPENTPTLEGAARGAGLTVSFRPLMALDYPAGSPGSSPARVLAADDPALPLARAVAEVGFGSPGTDIGPAGTAERDSVTVAPNIVRHICSRAEAGHSVTAVVATDKGIVAVGQHQPVGDMAEIVAVATLPSARRRGHAAAVIQTLVAHAFTHGVRTVLLSAGDDDVARIYDRVGFRRIGTSCAAEPPIS